MAHKLAIILLYQCKIPRQWRTISFKTSTADRSSTNSHSEACGTTKESLWQVASHEYLNFVVTDRNFEVTDRVKVNSNTLTRAGPLLGAKRAWPGGGGVEHPPLTRLLGPVATCGKRHSKERKKS